MVICTMGVAMKHMNQKMDRQGAGERGQIKHTLVQPSYHNHMLEYAHLTQVQ